VSAPAEWRPSLADFETAARRLAGVVRRTPLLDPAPMREVPAEGLLLKLECLQVTGAFKARGAVNAVASLDPGVMARGIVTASGGNHGLGVAYAGWRAGVPTTVFLGTNTPAAKIDKLTHWGARVVVEGAGWDEANEAALALAARENLAYVHPFADAAVIAGQGTLALEALADAPDLRTFVVPIGGGGLISGVAAAAKLSRPGVRVVGVEPEGAPTLSASLAAGRLVTLPAIDTAANTLSPRRTEPVNLGCVREFVDQIVLVSDAEMTAAARWLWFECALAAELAGAAATAALIAGKVDAPGRVCAVVSGAGDAGLG